MRFFVERILRYYFPYVTAIIYVGFVNFVCSIALIFTGLPLLASFECSWFFISTRWTQSVMTRSPALIASLRSWRHSLSYHPGPLFDVRGLDVFFSNNLSAACVILLVKHIAKPLLGFIFINELSIWSRNGIDISSFDTFLSSLTMRRDQLYLWCLVHIGLWVLLLRGISYFYLQFMTMESGTWSDSGHLSWTMKSEDIANNSGELII